MKRLLAGVVLIARLGLCCWAETPAAPSPKLEEISAQIDALSPEADEAAYRKVDDAIRSWRGATKREEIHQQLNLTAMLRRRIASFLPPDFDIWKMRAPCTVEPSDHKYLPGISPSAIDDPEVRRDYEGRIRKEDQYGTLVIRLYGYQQRIEELDQIVAFACSMHYGFTEADRIAEKADLAGFPTAGEIMKESAAERAKSNCFVVEPYNTAFRRMIASPFVAEKIGEAVDLRTRVPLAKDVANDTETDMTSPINGPKGSGTFHLVARKDGERWQILAFTIALDESNDAREVTP